eukprot:3069206-Pyramimonas_sp.AAC.1
MRLTSLSASRLEGGWFSKGGFRLSGARTRLTRLQQFDKWLAAPFQHVAVCGFRRSVARIRLKQFATVSRACMVEVPGIVCWHDFL